MCAATMVSSCSGDSEPPASASKGASRSPISGDDLSPDEAFIVVRNLAGWWEDCGCSGTAVGGISRAPAAALGAKKLTFAFLGRTPLPADGTIAKHSTRNLTPYFFEQACRVWGHLGAVLWSPDNVERQAVSDFVGSNRSGPVPSDELHANIGAVNIVVSNDLLQLPELEFSSPLSSLGDRGREVLVVAIWIKASGKPRMNSEVSTLAPLTMASSTASTRLRQVIRSTDGSVVAVWRRIVSSDLLVDAELQSVAAGVRIAVAHVPGANDALLKNSTEDLEATTSTQYRTCGRCHEEAWNQWKLSRHHHAMTTLNVRLKQDDPRCVVCHAFSYTVGPKGAQVDRDAAAVTCVSCHDGSKEPRRACITCHTSHTDPLARYARALHTICVPANKPNAKCPSR